MFFQEMWELFISLFSLYTYSVPYHLPVVAVSTLNEISRNFTLDFHQRKYQPIFLFNYVFKLSNACHNICVEVKGQLSSHSSLLPSCVSWISNSGCQSWWQYHRATWLAFDSLNGPHFSVPLRTCYFSFWVCLYFNNITPHTHPIPPLPHYISRFAGVSFNKRLSPIRVYSPNLLQVCHLATPPPHTHTLYSTVYIAISLYASFPQNWLGNPLTGSQSLSLGSRHSRKVRVLVRTVASLGVCAILSHLCVVAFQCPNVSPQMVNSASPPISLDSGWHLWILAAFTSSAHQLPSKTKSKG